MTDLTRLPDDLPVPADDGAADHLPGMRLPSLELSASEGGRVDLSDLGQGRTVVYLYPLTGRPCVDLPTGWDDVPGARGCTTEACDFRDHFRELRRAGVSQVFGLSSQSTAYQAELAGRLHLPFTMLSDEWLRLADALRLPTFTVEGIGRLYSRLTLVVTDDVVEHVFYPVFPPDRHAQEVLRWVQDHPLDPTTSPATSSASTPGGDVHDTVSNIEKALAEIDELWSPRPLASINDYAVKAVRVQGEFVWHSHSATDELFLVVSGELDIELRDRGRQWRVSLGADDVYVVPRGVEHRPVSPDGAEILLLEPADTVNTGDAPVREPYGTSHGDVSIGD